MYFSTNRGSREQTLRKWSECLNVKGKRKEKSPSGVLIPGPLRQSVILHSVKITQPSVRQLLGNDCVIKELTGTVINVCFFNAFFHTYFIITITIVIHIIIDLRHYCSMLYINR